VGEWLTEALKACTLEERTEGYLLGRGAKEESYRSLGCVTWTHPYDAPLGDEIFRKKYGPPRGLKLQGWLVCPIYSPKGKVIGFEARNTERKALGLSPEAMEKIWNGGGVWVVEGLFDLFPLEWVVPPQDVVLSTLRARLSDKHVEFLRRFCTGCVHMVYDRDEQGLKATRGWTDETGRRRWGALDKLKRVKLLGREVPYLGGKDPGEIWDKGGVEALHREFDHLVGVSHGALVR
jgi:DNA primase